MAADRNSGNRTLGIPSHEPDVQLRLVLRLESQSTDAARDSDHPR